MATSETTAPEDAAVHVECQTIPLIAGVMNLRMMPQPKYYHQSPINDECNHTIDRYQGVDINTLAVGMVGERKRP
jgi:hypothetical protein